MRFNFDALSLHANTYNSDPFTETGIATLTNTVSFLEKTKLYIDINKLSTTAPTATATSVSVSTGGDITVERSSTPPVVGGSEYMAVG